MKVFALSAALAVITTAAALADDVPFAQPSPVLPYQSAAAIPGLADIMSNIQTRHAKLWYAGNFKNWPLADFELGKIKDAFTNAGMLYRNIPVDAITLISKPINEMSEAIKAKDEAAFVRGYKDFTNGCNACHRAAQLDFIVIRTPTASPSSNQIFQPPGKQ
jgi:hypothetical protein